MIFGIRAPVVFGLVFFLMIMTSGYFMYQAYVGTERVVGEIYKKSDQNTALVITALIQGKNPALAAMAALELDTINVRHSRASSFLATRTWLRFMSSMFGSVCIVIGCGFVLARITTDENAADLDGAGLKAAFRTTSPGLVLAFLGAILITVPLVADQEIRTNDKASFGYFIISSNHAENVGVDIFPFSSGKNTPPKPTKASIDESLKDILQ